MVSERRFTGRVGALLGILLLAASLRSAVVSVSPLLEEVTPAVGFTPVSLGVLAMLPPFAFGVFGFFTPRLINRWGLTTTLFVAAGMAVIGQLLRPLLPNVGLFLFFSVITLAGYGIGNVVLPPLVKKYFPHQIGLVTSAYVTMLAIGTWLPPQFAVPLAEAVSWQFSIAFWAVMSAIAVLPWILQLRQDRNQDVIEVGVQTPQTTPPFTPRIRPWRTRLGWGLAIYLAGNSAQTYVYFAWLPAYLQDQGIDTFAASSLLAYFALLGLPISLLVPLWIPKMKNPIIAISLFTVAWIIGHGGLLLFPAEAPVLWVTFSGIGQGTFPIALLMVNLRSRTTYGSGILSGFSQGVGYVGAAIAPLLFGVFYDVTGDWTAAFTTLWGAIIVMMVGAIMINPPNVIEDTAKPSYT